MNDLTSTLAGLLVLILLAGSATAWIVILRRIQLRQPLLPYTPRRRVPWTVVELVAAVIVFVGLSFSIRRAIELFYGIQVPPGDLDELVQQAPQAVVPMLLGLAVVGLVTVVAVIVVARAFSGATWRDLGFNFEDWRGDVRVGAMAALAALVPVYGIRSLTMIIFPAEDAVHQMLRVLQQRPDLTVFLIVAVNAAIVAPIWEEFIFRGVLQGWLQSILTPRQAGSVEAVESEIEIIDDEFDDQPQRFEPVIGEPVAQPPPYAVVIAIAVSSITFSLLHGLFDAPALLPLAVILGYVYYRTGRLLPCMIAHAAFNGLSVAAVWLSL